MARQPTSLEEVDARHINELGDMIRARAAALIAFKVEEDGAVIRIAVRVTDRLFHHVFSIASNAPIEIELAHAERMMEIWGARYHQLLAEHTKGTYGKDKG